MTTDVTPTPLSYAVQDKPSRFAIPREAGMLLALVAICLGLFFSNESFLGQSNIVNVVRLISMLGILSIGIGFVIVTGGIDLSIGSIIGLTGVIIAKLCSVEAGGLGLSAWIGIPVALLVAILIGFIQGSLITRLDLQPFIVTLGGMLMLRGVSQTIVRGGTISLNGTSIQSLYNSGFLDSGSGPIISSVVLIFLAVIVIAALFLHYTVFGRYVYAIGGNREAARYSGIPVKKVETSTYVISAFLAGVAGICYASYIGQMSQNVGISLELYAIAAAVLGGLSLRGGEGTVFGIVIGSAVMRVIENGIIMFQVPYVDTNGISRYWRIDTNTKDIIIGGVILIAVVLDQVAHIIQARRRTRRSAALAAARAA